MKDFNNNKRTSASNLHEKLHKISAQMDFFFPKTEIWYRMTKIAKKTKKTKKERERERTW